MCDTAKNLSSQSSTSNISDLLGHLLSGNSSKHVIKFQIEIHPKEDGNKTVVDNNSTARASLHDLFKQKPAKETQSATINALITTTEALMTTKEHLTPTSNFIPDSAINKSAPVETSFVTAMEKTISALKIAQQCLEEAIALKEAEKEKNSTLYSESSTKMESERPYKVDPLINFYIFNSTKSYRLVVNGVINEQNNYSLILDTTRRMESTGMNS